MGRTTSQREAWSKAVSSIVNCVREPPGLSGSTRARSVRHTMAGA